MKKSRCRTSSISVFPAVFVACAAVAANTPIPMADSLTNTLTTAWGLKVTPENAWREYPRPQMVRGSWQCLNGEWEFAVTSVTSVVNRPLLLCTGRGRLPVRFNGSLLTLKRNGDWDYRNWGSGYWRTRVASS